MNIQGYDVIVKSPVQTVTEKNLVKIISWDKNVVIQRSSFSDIQSDQDILVMVKAHQKESDGPLPFYDQVADKLVYYYQHYLLNTDNNIKTYFYNKYFNLLSDLADIGSKSSNIDIIQEIAKDAHAESEKVLLQIKDKLKKGKDSSVFKEISKMYENLRKLYTSYGEQVENVLDYIVQNLPVYFYQ